MNEPIVEVFLVDNSDRGQDGHRIIRQVLCYDAIRADPATIANGYTPDDFRPSSNKAIITDDRAAFAFGVNQAVCPNCDLLENDAAFANARFIGNEYAQNMMRKNRGFINFHLVSNPTSPFHQLAFVDFRKNIFLQAAADGIQFPLDAPNPMT